ncbi:hypothetical protein RFI_00083 [Reticulomyxa filosa]|uniref:Uncharacterized protein n=1 Tax=Reticulomyxa filosa TaxID=46433 RepID=X6PG28_RETFI|nr:hypothetical protein RFI_00083 [Reticulomyxa filosa]|eukprot:ETO36979.1 hypothetical protein RFI_00083 [Reticulomyxa filosa]
MGSFILPFVFVLFQIRVFVHFFKKLFVFCLLANNVYVDPLMSCGQFVQHKGNMCLLSTIEQINVFFFSIKKRARLVVHLNVAKHNKEKIDVEQLQQAFRKECKNRNISAIQMQCIYNLLKDFIENEEEKRPLKQLCIDGDISSQVCAALCDAIVKSKYDKLHTYCFWRAGIGNEGALHIVEKTKILFFFSPPPPLCTVNLRIFFFQQSQYIANCPSLKKLDLLVGCVSCRDTSFSGSRNSTNFFLVFLVGVEINALQELEQKFWLQRNYERTKISDLNIFGLNLSKNGMEKTAKGICQIFKKKRKIRNTILMTIFKLQRSRGHPCVVLQLSKSNKKKRKERKNKTITWVEPQNNLAKLFLFHCAFSCVVWMFVFSLSLSLIDAIVHAINIALFQQAPKQTNKKRKICKGKRKKFSEWSPSCKPPKEYIEEKRIKIGGGAKKDK